MSVLDPQFLIINRRRLFCLRSRPAPGNQVRYRVLVAPPFAEELNKCRRLLALTLDALGQRGCDVLLPDLYGTGDSAGELHEVGWEDWVEDWCELAGWHGRAVPDARPAVLALRSGALLADAALATGSSALAGAYTVLVQPVLDGKRFLQQFLRVRVMGERMAGGGATIAELEQQLAAGARVEIGGYPLTRRLTAGLAADRVGADPFAGAAAVQLLEFKPAGGSVSAPAQQLCEQLTARGRPAGAICVASEQFWATQEITAPPTAIAALVDAFR